MKQTQGERLAELLKVGEYTYLELNLLGLSTSSWKRLEEWERRNPDWKVVRGKRYLGDGKYATTLAVRPAQKPAREDALWRPTLSA